MGFLSEGATAWVLLQAQTDAANAQLGSVVQRPGMFAVLLPQASPVAAAPALEKASVVPNTAVLWPLAGLAALGLLAVLVIGVRRRGRAQL